MNEKQHQRFQRQARNDTNLAHRVTSVAAGGLILGTTVALAGSIIDAFTGTDYSVMNPVVETGFGIMATTTVAYFPVTCYLMGREIYRECRGFNEQAGERNSEINFNGQ